MKKLISLVLSLSIMAFTLSGCGTPKEDIPPDTSGETQAQTEANNASTPPETPVDYPNGAVTVIVPYAAGGGTDLVARALVDSAKADFPKNISVENRTGGGGAVGMLYGSNANPDGSAVTMVTVELTTLPHTGTGAGLSYEQFKPIMMVNSAYSAITVKADSEFNTLDDLLKHAKDNDIQIGNSGVGAIWHLAAAGLGKAAGVEFTHIPYDGAAPAITDLLGGHIDAVSVSYAEVAPQIQAGELKVLAVMAPERLEAIPDIPTCKELGYDISIGTWRGLGVPKDTPDEIVNKLYEIFSKAAESDSFKEFMNSNNNVIEVLDSKEFEAKMASDNELFKSLISDLGLNQ